MSLVPSRSLAVVILMNRSCARSSALRCAGEVDQIAGKRIIMWEVWILVPCGRLGGSHRMLWGTPECFGGAGGHREKGHKEKII